MLGEPTEICHSCEYKDIADTLPQSLWDQIDPLIFTSKILFVTKRIREYRNGNLGDAQSLFVARYDLLRELHPDKFTHTHDDYWDGYYS